MDLCVIFVDSATETGLVNRIKHRKTTSPLEKLKEDKTLMTRNISGTKMRRPVDVQNYLEF